MRYGGASSGFELPSYPIQRSGGWLASLGGVKTGETPTCSHLCSARRNFTDPQYPNHAKTSRQVPPSHYGLAPPGLPDGPDVPGGSRWPRVSGACTGAQAASSKYSQRMSLASLCPAQTSPLGWRSRRRLPLPASLPLPPLLNCRKQLELGHGLFRRPSSLLSLRLTTSIVVISSWAMVVTSVGS